MILIPLLLQILLLAQTHTKTVNITAVKVTEHGSYPGSVVVSFEGVLINYCSHPHKAIIMKGYGNTCTEFQ